MTWVLFVTNWIYSLWRMSFLSLGLMNNFRSNVSEPPELSKISLFNMKNMIRPIRHKVTNLVNTCLRISCILPDKGVTELLIHLSQLFDILGFIEIYVTYNFTFQLTSLGWSRWHESLSIVGARNHTWKKYATEKMLKYFSTSFLTRLCFLKFDVLPIWLLGCKVRRLMNKNKIFLTSNNNRKEWVGLF